MAVPFDPQLLAVTGAAVPVLEGVMQSTSTGAAHYSLSATGSLVYLQGGVQSVQSRLVWVSRNGAEQPLPPPARAYLGPRLSPDGRRVAVDIQEPESQIWLYDLSRETLTRLTFEGNNNLAPLWSPDGKRIAFISSKDGPQNIFWQLADGSGGLERLTTSDYTHVPMSWSPDGQLLSYTEVNPTTGYDLWVVRVGQRALDRSLRRAQGKSARRSRSSERHSTKASHGFPPTGAGWPIFRTNQAAMRFTCSPIRGPAGSGKSRRRAAGSRCGTETGVSCSTVAVTR